MYSIVGITNWNLPFIDTENAIPIIAQKLKSNINWNQISTLDFNIFPEEISKSWHFGYSRTISLTENIYKMNFDGEIPELFCRYEIRVPLKFTSYNHSLKIVVYPNEIAFIENLPFRGIPWAHIISELRWHNEIHKRSHSELIADKYKLIRIDYIYTLKELGINEIIICDEWMAWELHRKCEIRNTIIEEYSFGGILEEFKKEKDFLLCDFDEIINTVHPSDLSLDFRNWDENKVGMIDKLVIT